MASPTQNSPTQIIMEFSSNFPDDLITEILVRLSVESLLRFKCVCKNWYSLITSSCFVSEHYLRHKENSTSLFIPVYGTETSQSGTTIHVLPEKLLPGVIPELEKPSYLHIPAELDLIIGPVGGIFFLYKDDSRMALWNPTTREFRPLPSCFLESTQAGPGCFDCVFGFGFDPLSHDYKVVSIWFLYDEDGSNPRLWFASVYSLANDCWKNLNCKFDADPSMINSLGSTCVDGFYYWHATKYIKRDLTIRYFDMHNEVFGEIPRPDKYRSSKDDSCDLTIYKESLCLLVRHLDLRGRNVNSTDPPIDVWLMNDKKLWIKVLNVMPTRIELLNVVPTMSECEPLGFWGRDKFIFSSSKDIIVYDSKTRKFTHLLCKDDELCDAYVSALRYRESLVSIKGKNVCHRQGDILDLIQEFFEGGEEEESEEDE